MVGYDRVAELICPGSPNLRLVQNLKKLGRRIEGFHASDNAGVSLTKKTVRDALDDIKRAAHVLTKAYEDETYKYVVGMDPENSLNWQHLLPSIEKIEAFASAASKSLPFGSTGPEGPVPKLRGVEYDYITARNACAIVVFEGWKRQRQEPPGIRRQEALDASAALWAASDGQCSDPNANNEKWWKPLRFARDASSMVTETEPGALLARLASSAERVPSSAAIRFCCDVRIELNCALLPP